MVHDVQARPSVQAQIRHELLLPSVPIPDHLQPAHVRRQQPGILLFQRKDCGLADRDRAADIAKRSAVCAQTNQSLPRGRKPACLRRYALSSRSKAVYLRCQPHTLRLSIRVHTDDAGGRRARSAATLCNQKVFQRFSTGEAFLDPIRLAPATAPGLRRILWVLVLRRQRLLFAFCRFVVT